MSVSPPRPTTPPPIVPDGPAPATSSPLLQSVTTVAEMPPPLAAAVAVPAEPTPAAAVTNDASTSIAGSAPNPAALRSFHAAQWHNPNTFEQALRYHYGVDIANPLELSPNPVEDVAAVLGWSHLNVYDTDLPPELALQLLEAASQLSHTRQVEHHDRQLAGGVMAMQRFSRRTYVDSGHCFVTREDDLTLVLNEPEVALHVLRRYRDQSLSDIITGLVAQAMPFQVCRVAYQPLPLFVAASAPAPKDLASVTQSGNAEFESYTARLQDFFQRPSRLRAALQHGGLVSRIACMIMETDGQPLDPIVPDTQELYGRALLRWKGEEVMFTEVLSNDEISFICGLYNVPATKSMVYWWPLPDKWLKSGLHTYYWTPDCEGWFRKRLWEIRHGPATLHTSRQWGNCVRFSRSKLTKVLAAQRAFGDELLKQLVP
ncbi:hypothetical protein BXZ70DRAFT_1009310 [Cristinia sonorae]|uniref:Uncharacterized protein n=1 Tax=Cristinia sonorae TaxID=1940300 RepID=A0A8K0ULW3_9AGAR|nr:hypothetical protein BXZ70DRAFT_1009310 [Cristinia sonorae]